MNRLSILLRLARSGGVALVGSLGLLLGTTTSPAGAGEFAFAQCGAIGIELDGRFSRLGQTDRVDVRAGCRPSSGDLLGVYQDRRGGSFREGEGGQYVWRAPEGIGVVGLSVRARLRDANGLRAALVGRAADRRIELDRDLERDGREVLARWLDRSRPLDSVLARLRCNRASGCPNRADSVKGYFEVRGIEILADDRHPPALAGGGGLFGFESGAGWLAGRVGYSLRAFDVGAGIAELELRVNGYPVEVAEPQCSGIAEGRSLGFSPCPNEVVRTGRLDTATAPFQEGANRIEACTSDFSSPGSRPNTTCAEPVTVWVDNREPPPPIDFRTDTDGSWSADPEVGVMWDSTGDPGSGLSTVRWRLVEAGTERQVATGSAPGTARSTTIRVPEPGDYLLETRFADQAGNVGSPAVARVRFDDIPPPSAAPVPPGGWLSRDELPLPARVDPVAPAGPSGIRGYSVVASDGGPLAPCRSTVCDRSELTIEELHTGAVPVVAGLREGVNWISSVAVSGAWLPSRVPLSTRVMVDRTYPETTVSGIPDGWSRGPVEAVVRSTDGLSGMEPDPDDDGRPVTVIEAEGHEPVSATGDRAAITIEREGVTLVRFHARDLAGNANDGRLAADGERHAPPGFARVMVDRTAPSLRFLGRPDPARPEAVRFEVGDPVSGVGDSEVAIRPADSPGEQVPIGSTLEDGLLEAEVPSDDLPPGRYELIALATDRAGNRGTSGAVSLSLPLKTPVSIALSRRPSDRRILAGSVRIGDHRPGSRLDLVVEESFAPATGLEARRRTIRSAADGSFAFPVERGPGRSVRVLFEGTATAARSSSRVVRIVDRDRVTFSVANRSARNGRTLRMWGRVSGPGFGPAGHGKGVVIQYFDPSRRRWRPVEVLGCGGDGRFRFGYRFTTITSPQRILFRAASLAESGWPFRPSASRRIAVLVRP
jgi:hypothetical protein